MGLVVGAIVLNLVLSISNTVTEEYGYENTNVTSQLATVKVFLDILPVIGIIMVAVFIIGMIIVFFGLSDEDGEDYDEDDEQAQEEKEENFKIEPNYDDAKTSWFLKFRRRK